MKDKPWQTGRLLVALAWALAACGDREETAPEQPAAAAETAASPALPDPALCPARAPIDEGLRQRTAPIAVPTALRPVMVADMDNIAVSTLGGGTVCVDASWMEAIEQASLSPDGRFVQFDWGGYEAFGHVLVDRAGAGQVIDTGAAPVRSPSGGRMAAVEYSESGYGALNGFAVWTIGPNRVAELARVETLADGSDWRLDRWAGEDCVEISAIAWEDVPDDARLVEAAPRQRFHARAAGNGWPVQPGRCPGK